MFNQTPFLLTVKEPEGTLCYTRDDLIRYAGHGALIASSVVMRLLTQAFSDLSPEAPPERREFYILSAFPGLGVRDSIELVTRARTEGHYVVDKDAAPENAPKSPIGGAMYFEVAYRGRAFAYTFNPEIFDETWSSEVLAKQAGCPTAQEHADYVRYKYGVHGALLTRDDAIIETREIDPAPLMARFAQ